MAVAFRYLATFLVMFLLSAAMPVPAAVASPQEPAAEEQSDPNDDLPSEMQTPDRVEVENVADDDQIENRLREILEASDYFENPNVESDNGFVTLSGLTDQATAKEWAETMARKTQDVVGVRNSIELKETVDVGVALGTVQSSLSDMWKSTLRQSPLLVMAAIVLLLTALVSRFGKRIIASLLGKKESLRANLSELLVTLFGLVVWIVGLLAAATIAFPGLTPSKALGVLGLGTVAVGFAFKDIFENFFAGVLMMWRYPFDRGDVVKLDDVMGRVKSITLRNTLIQRTDGELVVVPNATMFKSNVEVLTHLPHRRVRIMCGVAYDTDLDHAREVIEKAVSACGTVEKSRSVQVFANQFNDSSIDFEVAWWTDPFPLDTRRSRDEVVRSMKKALDAAGIEIPFPIRTIVMSPADTEAVNG